MALKDWKKNKRGNYVKNNFRALRVFRGLDNKWTIRTGIHLDELNDEHFTNKTGRILRTFKTKSQALKFARAYMIKH